MANEGIMALPQGTGMQGKQPQRQQPTVTSADSYDAAQTALGRVNPGEQAALKEALRQNIGNLQLTPQQLDALIQVFEYVSQHPGDYVNLLQKMLEAGVLDEGDMPPEYDPEFIGAMLAVLNEMQQMQAAGAQEPMDLSPVVQGLQPMGMASGGLADIGKYLASKGRGGDSMLAHINPEEAAMLKSRGGSGTINPNTGLLEFKGGFLGGVFDAIGGAIKGVADVAKDLLKSPVGRILGTIALATVLGPAGVGLSMGVAGGLAGAGTSLLAGGSMKEALVSGAMGYIGGGGTIMGVNPVAAVGRYLPGAAGTGIGAAGGALNTGLATGVIGAGIGKLGGMSTEDALKMGLTSGVSAGFTKGLGGMSPEDYRTSTDVFNRGMNGDTAALKIYEGGNIADMRAYLAKTSAPTFTAQPNPVTTPASGPIPTAAEILNQQPPYPEILGTTEKLLPFQNSGATQNLAPGQASFPESNYGAGQFASQNLTGVPEAQYGAGNLRYAANAGNTLPPPPVAGPPGFYDRMVTGAENMYDKYLSPDRPGLPSDVSFFRKYGPLAAAGTATIAAFGGMDSTPAEIDPITAGERARYEESRLRAKARRDRIEKGGFGLEGNMPSSYLTPPAAPLIYAANGGYIGGYAQGGMMGLNKVKRLYEGGDAAGYGYGEGEGAAQSAGMGGFGSLGEGYGDLGDYVTASQTSNTTRGTPAFDSVMLNQANSPVVANAYNNAVMTRSQDQDRNMMGNLYGYQNAQQARDAYDSFVAEQSMRNEGADGRAKGGYIGHYAYGGDVDERRQLVLERQADYGLEGNQLSTAPKRKRKVVKLPPVTIFDGGVGNDGGGGGGSGGLPGYGAYGNQGAFSNFLSDIGLTSAGQAVATNLGNQLNPGLTLTGADISGGQFAGNTAYGGGTGLGSGGAQGAHAPAGNTAYGGGTGLGSGGAQGAHAPAGDTAYGGGANALSGGIASLGGGSINAVENAIAQDISNAKMEAAAIAAVDAARFGTNAAMPASVQAAQDAANRAGIAEANLGGYGYGDNTGNFGGGSDSFGEGQYAKGGPARMTHFPRRDGPINGRGTGTSDDIPAMLSDGEFVFTAKAVRNAGGGSRRKGAARMYKLMKKLEGGAVKGN